MASAMDQFLRDLVASRRAVLALDYDGTLAPFHSRPQDALPHPGVREVLERIVAGGRTRLVLISGRPAAEVQALLALSPVPEIWGAHGWERLRDGQPLERASTAGAVAMALAAARTALESRGLLARAEWKIASVAVHWRDAADADAIAAGARAALAPLVSSADFEILPIIEGLEWRCRRWHKGTALATVLADEDPAVPVAYLGDDQTDEDAFLVLAGRGLAVRVGATPLATAATAVIEPAAGVLRFLEQWCEATRESLASAAAARRAM